MKKKTIFMLIFSMAVLSALAAQSQIPEAIRKAADNAPEDVLVGIGTAKESSRSLSIATAVNRATEGISRQILTMVQDSIRDYVASSEVDPRAAISFQEIVVREIISTYNANLSGITIAEEVTDSGGNYWVVAYFSTRNAVNLVNQAVATAKQRVPAMSSFVFRHRWR